MKRKYILMALLCCTTLTTSAQIASQNYVRTRTMLDETAEKYMDKIEYFDGLGRPFQTVLKKASTSNNNLITLQEYDVSGREANSWLPIASSAEYIDPATFKSSAPGNYSNDSRPYSQPVYETSPLNRIIKQYGPGAAWYSGHPVSTDYLANSTANAQLNCINYSVSSTDALVNNGSYASGQLFVVKTTDEDSNVSYTFTDKLGHTVLTRQMKGSETHDTYYVYDEKSNLRFVLQPMYQSSASLDSYAFQYKYDGFNRCIWKKLPGSGYIEYVYDTADRLIFSQDGNQRALTKWTYYLYDNLNRLTQQGECTGKNASSNTVVHVQNFYDNYAFRSQTDFNNSNFPDGGTNGKGAITGSITTVLGSSTKIYSANYYDIKGRIIKTVQSNLLKGYDITSTVYTFSGKPSTVTHTHTASGKTTRTEVYTYTYDAVDRVIKVEHTLNGSKITLALNTYDNLGRLWTKSLHGSAANKLTYTYNIRNWLTGINSTPFTQNLYYNTGNGTARYNGNISSMTWKVGNESAIRGYKFTYDGLNRMLNATYGETTAINSNANRFSENVTNYDKNGNIKNLQRYGQTSASGYGLIDNLTYTLTGNQLNRVDDAVTSTAYNGGFEFKNGASAAGEYAYDVNGNLTKDLNKGITAIQYNCLNLPNTVSFSDGSTITYTYAADGTKLRTVHKIGNVTTTTDYCGNVIYENGAQKYLFTEEGYVNLIGTQQYHYYLKDHQGNNRVVISQGGSAEETNHYYPFGGVFASTNTQPYKYNGKELDTKKGLNWYDYGARHYDAALGRFTTVDPLAEKYYSASPYKYCLNNPINSIDLYGKLVIFINGMHFGDGGNRNYWDKNGGGFASAVMKHLNDYNAMYIDGSIGGTKQFPYNLDPNIRYSLGYHQGELSAQSIIQKVTNSKGQLTETIKIITHSMGGAYAKGYIEALKQYLIENGIPLSVIEFEADFAPFQPTKQKAVKGVKTMQFTNMNDNIANNELLKSPFGIIQGAENVTIGIENDKAHSIKDFYDQIYKLPAGKYEVINGKIIPIN